MQGGIIYINCAYDVQRDDRISWLLVLEIGCKITVKVSHRQEMNDNAEKCFVDTVIMDEDKHEATRDQKEYLLQRNDLII